MANKGNANEQGRLKPFFRIVAIIAATGLAFWSGYQLAKPDYCCVHPLAQAPGWLDVAKALGAPFASIVAFIIAIRGERKADTRQQEEWERRAAEERNTERAYHRRFISALAAELDEVAKWSMVQASVTEQEPAPLHAVRPKRRIFDKLGSSIITLPENAIRVITQWESEYNRDESQILTYGSEIPPALHTQYSSDCVSLAAVAEKYCKAFQKCLKEIPVDE